MSPLVRRLLKLERAIKVRRTEMRVYSSLAELEADTEPPGEDVGVLLQVITGVGRRTNPGDPPAAASRPASG